MKINPFSSAAESFLLQRLGNLLEKETIAERFTDVSAPRTTPAQRQNPLDWASIVDICDTGGCAGNICG